MTEDEAFEYLNKHEIDFISEGVNFKVIYLYRKSERDMFISAFLLAYSEHGLDVFRNKVHYKVMTAKYGFYHYVKSSIIDELCNRYFGPYYAEVLLSRENEIVINANSVNISDVEQIIINTKTITSIKAKKSEIINNSYEFEQSDFIRLLNIIENIEKNLLENKKQDINDLNFLKEIKEKVPKLCSLIADIITIVSPFF